MRFKSQLACIIFGFILTLSSISCSNSVEEVSNSPKNDIKAPVTITSLESGIYNNIQNPVILSCVDNKVACKIYFNKIVDGQSTDVNQEYSSPIDLSINATTELTFWAIDSSNNIEPQNKRTYTIDTIKT